MRSQIGRGSFKVVFIEYTPTGVTVHYEAALEGGGAVYGHKAMGRFFARNIVRSLETLAA